MTLACTSCGEILDPADDRCPYCGTLAPPLPGTSVFAHESTEPRWAEEPTVVGDPLSIPVREPGDAPLRRGQAPAAGLPRPVLVALGVVAALALLTVVAAQVLGSGGGDDDLASDEGSGAATEGTLDAEGDGAPADEGVAADASTTTEAPTSSTTSTSTTTTSTTTTSTTAPPSTTTTAARPSGPGDVPTLPSSFRGGWVAQLSSVPASAGTPSIEAAYERIRSDVPGAKAARSDEWPSMTAGYWVFVETGFGSEDAVRSFCSSVGRSGDACLPRELAGRR